MIEPCTCKPGDGSEQCPREEECYAAWMAARPLCPTCRAPLHPQFSGMTDPYYACRDCHERGEPIWQWERAGIDQPEDRGR